MNTAPTQSATASAVDMPSSCATSPEASGDLFALLLGSLGTTLMGEAADSSAPSTSVDDEPIQSEGDFSLLLSQLPGMDGLGLQKPTPLNNTFHFTSDAVFGGAANAAQTLPDHTAVLTANPLEAALPDVAGDDATALFSSVDPDADIALATSAPAVALGGAVARALRDSTELREVGDHLQLLPPTLQEAKNAAKLDLVLPPGSSAGVAEAFSEGMAVRVGWMADQQVGRAEITLHPEDLGSIDVALEFDGRSVRAEFTSANEEVRHLLESNMPRLRDLLEAQGFSLRDANVGSQQQGGGQMSGDSRHALGGGARPVHGDVATQPAGTPARRAVDHGGSLSEYA